MVSGVFAGDAAALSLAACFPRMRRLEDEHGSLFRALIATRRSRNKGDAAGAPAGRLTSFAGGMTDLVDALWTRLDGAVRTNAPVLGLDHRRQFTVGVPGSSMHADAVVLAGPATESSRLLAECDSELSALLAGIPSAPLAVVSLGFDIGADPVLGNLRGFGFLVPRDQGIRILGALWETSIYPNRAPEGKVLFRVMIGGACDRAAVSLDDAALVGAVRHDLARTMRLDCAPEFVHVVRHARGIPQYVTGHLDVLDRIDRCLERHRGLYLAGSSYRSPSVNACIAEADRIASAVIAQLGRDSGSS
jgi:protoporphyrinogen/coproporphyrinogen III oxidase